LERSPINSLAKLAQQADVSVFSARTTTKLMKLHPYTRASQMKTLKIFSQLVYCKKVQYSCTW
jgi:hypothetical protein